MSDDKHRPTHNNRLELIWLEPEEGIHTANAAPAPSLLHPYQSEQGSAAAKVNGQRNNGLHHPSMKHSAAAVDNSKPVGAVNSNHKPNGGSTAATGGSSSPFILLALPLVHYQGNYFQSAFRWLCQDPERAACLATRVRSGLKNVEGTVNILKAFYSNWERKWTKFTPRNPKFSEILNRGCGDFPPTNNPSVFATKQFWQWYYLTPTAHPAVDHMWFMEMFRVWVNMTSEGTYCLEHCTRGLTNRNIYGFLEVLRYRAVRDYRKEQLSQPGADPQTVFPVWNPFEARIETRQLCEEDLDLQPQRIGHDMTLRQQREARISRPSGTAASAVSSKRVGDTTANKRQPPEEAATRAVPNIQNTSEDYRRERVIEVIDLCSLDDSSSADELSIDSLLRKNSTVRDTSYTSLLHLLNANKDVVEPSKHSQLQTYLERRRAMSQQKPLITEEEEVVIKKKDPLACTVYPSTSSSGTSKLTCPSVQPPSRSSKEGSSTPPGAAASTRRLLCGIADTKLTESTGDLWVEIKEALARAGDDVDMTLSAASYSSQGGDLSSSIGSAESLLASLLGAVGGGGDSSDSAESTAVKLEKPPQMVLPFVSDMSAAAASSPRRKLCCPPISPRQPHLETSPTAADSSPMPPSVDTEMLGGKMSSTCYCDDLSKLPSDARALLSILYRTHRANNWRCHLPKIEKALESGITVLVNDSFCPEHTVPRAIRIKAQR